MKKSDILTGMRSPGIYTTDIDHYTAKTFWFPFKRKQKLKKIITRLNNERR